MKILMAQMVPITSAQKADSNLPSAINIIKGEQDEINN